MMHNEVEGVQIGIIKYLKNRFFILELDRSFLTLDRGCEYCILQKKLMCLLNIYVAQIQLIVLNIESNCNLASNKTIW